MEATQQVSTTDRVLAYLAKYPSSGSSDVGTVINNRRGRIASASGGGDYAAQMLLGRMRKAGLIEQAPSEGSTKWKLTSAGRTRLRR